MRSSEIEQALIEAQAKGVEELAAVSTLQLYIMLASVTVAISLRRGRGEAAADLRDLADVIADERRRVVN